jgi:hypothetical protein
MEYLLDDDHAAWPCSRLEQLTGVRLLDDATLPVECWSSELPADGRKESS